MQSMQSPDTGEHPDTILSHRSVRAAIINHHGSAKHVLTAVAPLTLTHRPPVARAALGSCSSLPLLSLLRSLLSLFHLCSCLAPWPPTFASCLSPSPRRKTFHSFLSSLLLRFSPLTSPFACFVLESYVFPRGFSTYSPFPLAVRRSPFAVRLAIREVLVLSLLTCSTVPQPRLLFNLS